MIKKYKNQLLSASIVTLLPMVLGLLIFKMLPDLMVPRWGFDGSLPVLGFLLLQPLALLGLLWLCIFITTRDPGNQGRNQKVTAMMFWIIPILSNLIAAMLVAISLDSAQNAVRLFPIPFGLLFAVIGNFMPKTRRNATIGIRIPWTLASDENWSATHRLAGRLWFLGGIVLMLTACLPTRITYVFFLVLLLVMVLVPMAYSYAYYKKQCRAGTAPDLKGHAYSQLNSRWGKWSLLVISAILIFVAVIMFTGDIHFSFEADRFTVNADYHSDLTLSYSAIDSISFRENDDRGTRAFGWGSPRLLLGAFENEEFGIYTRYSYTGCDSCVVVKSGGKVLVLSGRDEDETRALFEELTARLGPAVG